MPNSGTGPEVRHDVETLRAWTERVLRACGLPIGDARTAAGVILRCELRGRETHGLARLHSYVTKLRRGEVKARPEPHAEDCQGTLWFNGGGGLGQVVATMATEQALKLAAARPFVPCLMRDVGHLGALGSYVLQAAEAGMVALLVQSTPPVMAPPGARRAAIGNNPLAFACPVPGRDPLVFDMATSNVARGHVLMAERAGRPIPEGWAIGPDGRPTTDPRQALEGAMLPVGGPKGIGLAMMVECLAGSLSGTTPPPMREADGSSGSAAMHLGAFLIVANPERLAGRAVFDAHVSAWVERYLAAGAGARLPGQRAAATERARRANGLQLSAEIVRELAEVGEQVDCPFPTSGRRA